MARARRRSNSTLIDDLFRHPEAFEFFQAIRVAERAAMGEALDKGLQLPEPVGRGVDPRRGAVGLVSSLSLGFAVAEVSEVRRAGPGRLELVQSVSGLVGASGVMPLAVSEIVQASVRARNPALRAFLDLFSDRLAALLFDAWAKQRIVIEAERSPWTGRAPIEDILRSLIGLGTPSLRERMSAPDALLLRHGGLLARQTRSAHGVEQVLTAGLGMPVAVEQFVGEWVVIAPGDRTVLPRPGRSAGNLCRLDEEAVLGERTFIVQGAVRLSVGPLDYGVFAGLLPNGALRHLLEDLAAFALGPDMVYRLRLTLKPEEVPPLRLCADADDPRAPRLGWNTWLGQDGPRAEPGRMDLDPHSALGIG